MGYYVSVCGKLKCKDIKKATEILENTGYLDEDEDYEIIVSKKECVCEKCGIKHYVTENRGIIKFHFKLNFNYDDIKDLAEICKGSLLCQGEDIGDLYKLVFRDKKMKIIKPKWDE